MYIVADKRLQTSLHRDIAAAQRDFSNMSSLSSGFSLNDSSSACTSFVRDGVNAAGRRACRNNDQNRGQAWAFGRGRAGRWWRGRGDGASAWRATSHRRALKQHRGACVANAARLLGESACCFAHVAFYARVFLVASSSPWLCRRALLGMLLCASCASTAASSYESIRRHRRSCSWLSWREITW